MTPKPTNTGRTGWEAIVDLALAEDIGTGDITTLATIPAEATADAHGIRVPMAEGVAAKPLLRNQMA